MKAHVFSISFLTAHFKRHETKKFRSSYLLPPPTAIWGILGAIFGISRDKLDKFVDENDLIVGAEISDFKGLANEKATLMSWDTNGYLRTVEGFEFLIRPIFRVGVYAKDELIENLKQKIEMKNFEFDIYGGISDCFLENIINENDAKFIKKTNVKGMIPVNLLDKPEVREGSRIIRILYLSTFFYQGYNVEFKVKKPLKTVNGISIWSKEDVERFRKGDLE